jgi:Flp pilus assembly protein TadD
VDEQRVRGGEPNEDDDRESVYGLLQRGQALIRRRHHAQAAIVLERAAREEPRKGSILEPLGRAYHHSGQFEQARAVFAELLEIDPSAPWAHFAMSESLRKLGRIDEARTHIRLAVALSPSSELYRHALARLEPPLDEGQSRTD